MLHWLSHTTGSVCYLCIADVFNGYSTVGISGYWETNGIYSQGRKGLDVFKKLYKAL